MKARMVLLALLLLAAIGLSACVKAPAALSTPTTTIAPTTGVYIPNLENGEAAWKKAQCGACHGPSALGGIGQPLAATKLLYNEFLGAVRRAIPPMPSYDEDTLPGQTMYDLYAWVRTQLPAVQTVVQPTSTPPNGMPQMEQMMSMTIWTCKKCSTCHGVFAQGSATAPALAGVSESVEKVLAQMRSTAATISEHSADNIPDDIFARLYRWLKAGCVTNECSQ